MKTRGDPIESPAGMSRNVIVESARLIRFVAKAFAAVGVPEAAAGYVAECLVEADEQGIASHGVMLVPMYVERIQAGSISLETEGTVVADIGATAVIDARNALGQLTARQAAAVASGKAKQHGLGAVAVRNAFHFGTAGRFALDMARAGHIGIVACNTRPLLPAPGGAEALVGNNPIAIAMPSAGDGPPALLDMATSASAMGKIRMAEAAGASIPADWATDAEGRPTTDPSAAISGMLLPAAGPKGFGLAFMIDLLCGGLSSGGTGGSVTPLYGDASVPYNCAHFFLAIDAAHFGEPAAFAEVVAAAVDRVRGSRPAPGAEPVMSPGEPAWSAQREAAGRCRIDEAVWQRLCEIGDRLALENDCLVPAET